MSNYWKTISEKGLITATNGITYRPVMVLDGIGETLAQTSGAQSVVADSGKLYYADYTAKKVIIFDAVTYAKLGETAVQEGYAYSIAVDSDKLYYADGASNKVIIFNAVTYAKLGETAVQTGTARAIAIDSGKLYYADYTAKKVIIFGGYVIDHYTEVLA